MNKIKHPCTQIAPELVAILRKKAGEAELLKQLHPDQLTIIREEKWFQLFVPRQYGGLQLTLLQALQLEEAIAWADGAIGWTVTLCAGAGWFIGFLDPALASSIFDGDKVCLAGSGKASGTATRVANGRYEITGFWDYATGSHFASVFTANCVIAEAGAVVTNTAGDALVQSFVFLESEVTVHENWQRIGMIATGSNSFEVNKLLVDESRTFVVKPTHALLKDTVYQYPFRQFAETTLAINHSGMAIRFLDLCKILLALKPTPPIQQLLSHSLDELEAARRLFYNSVAASLEALSNSMSIAPSSLQQVSAVSKQLAFTSRQIVDALYPYCGMQAANPETEISRVWRNLHTASQHNMFNQ